ncbi:MAG: NADPH-dependent F420 reductase, partial [uncultured Nocardioidaceae bacterium]
GGGRGGARGRRPARRTNGRPARRDRASGSWPGAALRRRRTPGGAGQPGRGAGKDTGGRAEPGGRQPGVRRRQRRGGGGGRHRRRGGALGGSCGAAPTAVGRARGEAGRRLCQPVGLRQARCLRARGGGGLCDPAGGGAPARQHRGRCLPPRQRGEARRSWGGDGR